MAKNYSLPIPLQSIASSTMDGTYKSLGALPQACSILSIINGSNQVVTVAYGDPTVDNDLLAVGETTRYSFQANATPNSSVNYMKAGTIVYVKSSAGTGTVGMSGFYQPN